MNYFCRFESPLGEMILQTNNAGLTGAWFETQTTLPDDLGQLNVNHDLLKAAKIQLSEYFQGQRKMFNLPLAATGTAFQTQIWRALTLIPSGETWSYQQLAKAINNPKAVRAVGLANGKNPLSIIVPCHRVIGKNGKLTGYAGGVERKKWLLEHEGVSLPNDKI